MEKEGSREAGLSQNVPEPQRGCHRRFVTGVDTEQDLETAEPGASALETGSLLQHFLWDWPGVKEGLFLPEPWCSGAWSHLSFSVKDAGMKCQSLRGLVHT